MDSKLGTFLLGVIAAVVLIMLWKKEQGSNQVFPWLTPPAPSPAPSPSCGAGCGSGLAAPVFQALMSDRVGTGGQISPGTPPLNAATGGQGATSFYSPSGPTADTSFTFTPVLRNARVGSTVQPPVSNNVPGSPSTPATVTPTRATQPVPGYSETGFQQRYNIAGVPRTVLSTGGYIQ